MNGHEQSKEIGDMMERRRARATRMRWGLPLVMMAVVAACGDSPVAPAVDGPDRIELEQESITARSHQEVVRFTARLLNAAGEEVPGADLEWSTDDPAILESLGDGAFRTLTDGTARVTVRLASPRPEVSGQGYEDAAPRAEAEVHVEQVMTGVALFLADSTAGSGVQGGALRVLDVWAVDDHPSLTVRHVDAQGQPMQGAAGPSDVSWTTRDEEVLVVDASGTVVPVADGTSAVVVRVGEFTEELTVRVRTTQTMSACARLSAGGEGEVAQLQCGSLVLTFVRGEGS